MFNLLRRRMKNKQKKIDDADADVDVDVEDESVPRFSAIQQYNQSRISKNATITKRNNGKRHYRQFGKNDEDDVKTLPNTVVATVVDTVEASITETTACKMRQDENFKSYLHKNDEQVEKAIVSKNSTNAGKIYFENLCDNNQQIRVEKQKKAPTDKSEKINLAKTAANFTYKMKNENTNTNSNPNTNPNTNTNINSAIVAQSDANVNYYKQYNNDDQLRLLRQLNTDTNTDHFSHKFSQNEPAEWQGRVQKNCFHEHLNQNQYQHFNTTNKSNVLKENISSIDLLKENVEYKQNRRDNQRTNNQSTKQSVINEVRFRNLGNVFNNQRVQHKEGKWQSRLSWTGLNINNDKKLTNTNSQTEEKEIKRKSKLFFTSLKALPKKTEDKPLTSATTSLSSLKLNKLQKSREFLSDIFMARGRNQNRNRYQNTFQQQQQQQQQQQHHQHSKIKVDTIASSNNNTTSSQINRLTTKGASINTSNVSLSPRRQVNNNSNQIHNYQPKSKNVTTTTTTTTATGNVVEEGTGVTHLETSVDHANCSTNSYQITVPNNSNKIFRTNAKDSPNDQWEQERAQEHSNSATYEKTSHSLLNKRTRSLSVTSGICDERDRIVADDCQPNSIICAVSLTSDGCNLENTANDNNENGNHEENNINAAVECANGAVSVDCNAIANRTTNVQNNNEKVIQNNVQQTENALKNSVNEHYNNNNNNNNNNNTNSLKKFSSFTKMGQVNTKSEESHEPIRTETISNENREGLIDELPKITVDDYTKQSAPIEQEVFYDFENEKTNNNINITAVDDDGGTFYDTSSNTQHVYGEQINNNNGLFLRSQMRQNYTKLEDVPEDEEEEKPEDEEENEEENDNDDDDEEEEEEDESEDSDCLKERRKQHDLQHNDSGEYSPLKSCNKSDSTLSGCPSDSGFGEDSRFSATHLTTKKRSSQSPSATTTLNPNTMQKQTTNSMPFVRDGNSTDCDEMLLPCDDLDFCINNERLVCIESISLPDVVVESTTASLNSNGYNSTTMSTNSSTSSEHIININGASGNSMGNVHFIPIHVEGSSKKRSFDDSVINNDMTGEKIYMSQVNGEHQTTIEIIEDESMMNYSNHQTEKLK